MPAMWEALLAPAVPWVALSPLALIQAISSLRSFAGNAFLLTISCGLLATSEIGSKSLSTSYCSG